MHNKANDRGYDPTGSARAYALDRQTKAAWLCYSDTMSLRWPY